MESIIVKIGGELIAQPEQLEKLAHWLTNQKDSGQNISLVHGAGKQVDLLCKQLNIPIFKVEGRRITNQETLEATVQIVGGLVNKTLVSELNKHGLNSIGITAADGNITTAVRRNPWTIKNKTVDFGFVGEIQKVNPALLELLMHHNYLPVIGCLTWSESEGLLNINADTLATELAKVMKSDQLILLTGTGSVWDRDGNEMSEITYAQFQNGKETGWIKEGMIPKLFNGFKAMKHGVTEVRICSPENLENGGTKLVFDQEAEA